MYLSILKDVVMGQTKKSDADFNVEELVKSRTGAPYAVCVPKARVGIYLVIRALIKRGQKVILSPYTISDVVNMVICAGGVPVFADIERKTNNIDPAEIEKLIDQDTGAVLVTHLHGYVCDMDRIVQICRSKGVPLVEDAAQAFGAVYNLQSVGTFGAAGIFSFGMYKNVNAFFGGMVVTNDKKLHDRLRQEIREFPYQEIGYYLSKVASGFVSDVATYPPIFKMFTFWIFKYGCLHDVEYLTNKVAVDINPVAKKILPESYLRRMMPMQAKLAIPQFKYVDQNSDRRINFARMYHEGLKNIQGLVIAPLHDDRRHIYTYYTIQAPDRDALVKYLMKHNCDVAISHHKNCADLQTFGEFYRDCPSARTTANSLIFLPTYPKYSGRHVKKNVELIKMYFVKNGR